MTMINVLNLIFVAVEIHIPWTKISSCSHYMYGQLTCMLICVVWDIQLGKFTVIHRHKSTPGDAAQVQDNGVPLYMYWYYIKPRQNLSNFFLMHALLHETFFYPMLLYALCMFLYTLTSFGLSIMYSGICMFTKLMYNYY